METIELKNSIQRKFLKAKISEKDNGLFKYSCFKPKLMILFNIRVKQKLGINILKIISATAWMEAYVSTTLFFDSNKSSSNNLTLLFDSEKSASNNLTWKYNMNKAGTKIFIAANAI